MNVELLLGRTGWSQQVVGLLFGTRERAFREALLRIANLPSACIASFSSIRVMRQNDHSSPASARAEILKGGHRLYPETLRSGAK